MKVIAFAFVLTYGLWSSAQSGKATGPEPPTLAQCKFSDGKLITVGYPGMQLPRARNFGGVGSDEATTFTSNEDLITIKGTDIPPGQYEFSIVPDSDNWMFIIKRVTADSAIAQTSASREVARVPMSITKISSPIEKFTISFDHTGGSCKMNARWENTHASLEFTERNTDLPVTR